MRILSLLLLSLCAHAGVVYQFDDGTAEKAITAGGPLFWLNQFTVQAGGETINTVRLAFGYPGCYMDCHISNASALTVYLWSDPNQDGNPSDAQVLSSLTTTMSSVNTDTFTTYLLTPVTLAVGDKFFAGAGISGPPDAVPAALDTDTNSGVSWGSLASDPNNLSSGTLGTIGDFGFPGNWLIRAESGAAGGGAVPEPATWSLLAAGGGFGMLLRRRRHVSR